MDHDEDEPQGGGRSVTIVGYQPAEARERPSPRQAAPLIELEVVHEHGPAPSLDRPFGCVEIWTRNRIYLVDAQMICLEVRDRSTRQSLPEHAFLGMRLVGGQGLGDDRMELSFPFPRPGNEAVFETVGKRKLGFSRTSEVARVILRMHIVTVAPSRVIPTWEELSGSFTLKDPPG